MEKLIDKNLRKFFLTLGCYAREFAIATVFLAYFLGFSGVYKF